VAFFSLSIDCHRSNEDTWEGCCCCGHKDGDEGKEEDVGGDDGEEKNALLVGNEDEKEVRWCLLEKLCVSAAADKIDSELN